MNWSPALSLFLGFLIATQILIALTFRAFARHIIGHLHEMLGLLAPLRIDVPQIKGAYAEGYKAGVLEQTRRYNEELNSPGKPPEPRGETAA